MHPWHSATSSYFVKKSCVVMPAQRKYCIYGTCVCFNSIQRYDVGSLNSISSKDSKIKGNLLNIYLCVLTVEYHGKQKSLIIMHCHIKKKWWHIAIINLQSTHIFAISNGLDHLRFGVIFIHVKLLEFHCVANNRANDGWGMTLKCMHTF